MIASAFLPFLFPYSLLFTRQIMISRPTTTRKRFLTYCYGVCAALCMFINGFDACELTEICQPFLCLCFADLDPYFLTAVFNNLQGIQTFMNYMHLDKDAPEDQSLIGAVTSSYMTATIIAGLSVSPMLSNYCGRRVTIFIGCFIVVTASFIQSTHSC